MGHSETFPFTALVGQEKMKLALILNVIDPSIDGVLIRGERGTAKSTAVRGLVSLLPDIEVRTECGFSCHPTDRRLMCAECREREREGTAPVLEKRRMRVVDLPVGATEDRVVGSLDIEHALKSGKKRFEPGLLAEVHRSILYVDEVNLLDDHLVDVLLDAAAMGVNRIEREGVSFSHPSRFMLVGTMNPEEGELRPQLLDRFGLCVDVEGIEDPAERVAVIKRRRRWEENPEGLKLEWAERDGELRKRIQRAMELLPGIAVDDETLEIIATLSIDLGADGHRGDLAMVKTVVAYAAFQGRSDILPDDVATVAKLVYPHRMKKSVFEEKILSQEEVVQSVDRTRERIETRRATETDKKKAI